MESKLPLTPVRSRTWHATPTEKVVIPAPKRPATTLGITHPPATTSTAVLRRPKTTSGISHKDPDMRAFNTLYYCVRLYMYCMHLDTCSILHKFST